MKPLPPPLRQKHNLGYFGETLAASYLTSRGHHIIQRNFKARYGEIDIISTYGDILVFIEVKTRIGEKFGKPEEAITPRKLREVVLTSKYYVLLHPELPEALRIDLIAIALNGDRSVKYLKHIENITQ